MEQLYYDELWNVYEQNGSIRIHKNTTLHGYKAFCADMTCINHHYQVGETYTMPEEDVNICESGFHFCRYPADVMIFYMEEDTKYAIVKADGACC